MSSNFQDRNTAIMSERVRNVFNCTGVNGSRDNCNANCCDGKHCTEWIDSEINYYRTAAYNLKMLAHLIVASVPLDESGHLMNGGRGDFESLRQAVEMAQDVLLEE